MKDYLKRIIRYGVRKLVGTEDLQRRLDRLEDMQRQLAETFEPLSARRLFNEVATASRGVQQVLARGYQEMLRGPRLPDLHEMEFRCYSQNGEDGLLLYLFSLVGTTNKRAVEICCGNGVECNSANLVINHGWNALLVDGDERNVELGRRFYARCPDTLMNPPTLVQAWITAEGVNDLVAGHGFAGEIDLLSLDMDGVDYWVWKGLTCVRPRVVVLEFNARWGPHRAVTVPYRPDFRLDFRRHPWCGGASLPAFVKLGRQRGYRLVGTQRTGVNALLLRDDVAPDLFPEISVPEAFARVPNLRGWAPDWVPSRDERPEWWDVVEV